MSSRLLLPPDARSPRGDSTLNPMLAVQLLALLSSLLPLHLVVMAEVAARPLTPVSMISIDIPSSLNSRLTH